MPPIGIPDVCVAAAAKLLPLDSLEAEFHSTSLSPIQPNRSSNETFGFYSLSREFGSGFLSSLKESVSFGASSASEAGSGWREATFWSCDRMKNRAPGSRLSLFVGATRFVDAEFGSTGTRVK